MLSLRAKFLRLIAVFILLLSLELGDIACTPLASPRQLVDEADKFLSQGGLQDPRTRGRMKSLYDEALRRLPSFPQLTLEERLYVETHAHFGLAMNRLWDLLDRLIVVLEEGGILKLLREGVTGGERPAFCPFLEDIQGFEKIFNLLVDTALRPIIEDLRVVVRGDPSFRIQIVRTVYPLGAFTLDPIGPHIMDLSGVYGRAEAAFMAGVLELLIASFKTGVAYEGLMNNLALFLLIQKKIRLNQVAKWFNSNPCVDYPQEGNPLFNPRFAVLRQGGPDRLAEAREFLIQGIGHLRTALDLSFSERDIPQFSERILNGANPGSSWGTGLVEVGESREARLKLEFPSGPDPPMKALVELNRLLTLFLKNLTPQVPMPRVSLTLAEIQSAIEQGFLWDVRSTLARLLPPGGLAQLVEEFSGVKAEGIPSLAHMETPWIDLGKFFRSPPGDLKLLFPWYYLADEPYTDANRNGRRDPEQGVRLVDKEVYLSTEDYQDLNCNGRWDERGDLIVIPEHIPYRDEDGDNLLDSDEADKPLGHLYGPKPPEVGLWGMFLDVNADGYPDRAEVDGLLGRHTPTRSCGLNAPPGVSWPIGEGDSQLKDSRIRLVSPTPDAPYGIPVTSPLNPGEVADGSILGPVLGHYYPPRNWDFGSWPFSAARDAANGVTDQNYFFFPDPTFQRIIFRDLNNNPNENGTTNAWLNRMITQWSQILQRFLR